MNLPNPKRLRVGTGLPSQTRPPPKATRAPGRGQQRLAAAPARARATALTAVTAAGARLPALRRLGGARGWAEGTPQTHTQGAVTPSRDTPRSPQLPRNATTSPGGGAARFSSGVGTPGPLASPCQEFSHCQGSPSACPFQPRWVTESAAAGTRQCPQAT